MKLRPNSQVAEAAARSPPSPKSHHCGLKSHHMWHFRMVLHNVQNVLYKTWSVAWDAKPTGMLIRDCITWGGVQLVPTCLYGLLEIVPCTDFPTVPEAVEGSVHWQRQNCTSKCMEQAKCSAPWSVLGVTHSADPISAALICESNPRRKVISLGNHSAGSRGWGWQGEGRVAPGILGKGTLECRVKNAGVQGNCCEERGTGGRRADIGSLGSG